MPPKSGNFKKDESVKYWDIDYHRLTQGYLGDNEVKLKSEVYKKLVPDRTYLYDDRMLDTAIENELVSPQIYEIRRKLLDPSEGFKLWRELGMSISNTIKSVLNGTVWTRSIIEQGKNLGYASIEGQCAAGMTTYETVKKTCEYCDYSEDENTLKRRKVTITFDQKNDETRKNVIFSCEHVLEVGLLWLLLGISFPVSEQDFKKYVQTLYQYNYRMACCRCNFIKADIQVNKSIVPDSPSGEPTIFVGWNPVKKRFYVNMTAVNEFAKLVMCFSMRTTGAAGKGHKHILDHLSRTSKNVADGIAQIAKRTAACVNKCVRGMNTMIFELKDYQENDKNRLMFNPSVVRLAAYKTVYDIKIPKELTPNANGVSGGGKKDIYVQWLRKQVTALTEIIGSTVNERMFDNSIMTVSDTTVDDQRRNKVRFMFLLNELLEKSIEFEVYTNIANVYSLYNSSGLNKNGDGDKPYTRSIAQLRTVDEGTVNNYKEKVIKDITDTGSYVNSAVTDLKPIKELEKYIRHNVQNLSSVLGSIGSNLASDDKLSLYIDIWNILNEHITRTHKIFLELIKIEKDTDFDHYIQGGQNPADRFKKLLKVVRFCIGKGLCIILDNINRHCPDLVEYNRFSDNEFNFLFYELDSLIDVDDQTNDFRQYSQAILGANQHIKPIFGIYINSNGNLMSEQDDVFPILILELPTDITNTNINKAKIKHVRWTEQTYIPDERIQGTAVNSVPENNAEMIKEMNDAKRHANYATTDANTATRSDGENVVNRYNSDLQGILLSKLKKLRKSRDFLKKLSNITGGGSNLEIKLISGIGSMLRNEVTNKSKYNISTKRPKMNKKTRKNVFSLLEKRRKQTIAKKHRKNKTLRKK
jgi:hypothetical protein